LWLDSYKGTHNKPKKTTKHGQNKQWKILTQRAFSENEERLKEGKFFYLKMKHRLGTSKVMAA
jgi:hypothetical protein